MVESVIAEAEPPHSAGGPRFLCDRSKSRFQRQLDRMPRAKQTRMVSWLRGRQYSLMLQSSMVRHQYIDK